MNLKLWKAFLNFLKMRNGTKIFFLTQYLKVILNAVKEVSWNKASVTSNIPISTIKSFGSCQCNKVRDILNDCQKQVSKFNRTDKTSRIFLLLLKFLKESFFATSCLHGK